MEKNAFTAQGAITVEGDGGRARNYQDIKNTVVFIGNRYYFKHDSERVVPIRRSDGKVFYYRVNSPLIATDAETGERMLKSDMFKTEDGIFLNKKSQNVVEIDNKYYRKAYTVLLTLADGTNKLFLKTDPKLKKCARTEKYYLDGQGKKLEEKYYGKKEVHPDIKTFVTRKGEIIVKDHAQQLLNLDTGECDYLHQSDPDLAVGCVNILYDFQDKTNPQEDRLTFRPALISDYKRKLASGGIVPIQLTPEIKYEILSSQKNYFDSCIETYILPRYMTKINDIRNKINKNYSDLDKHENVADTFRIIARPFPGKHKIATPQNFGSPVRSRTFVETGGFQYSYGVEFETSQGLIDDPKTLSEFGIMAVGDRSIGAGEYVTSPMMGDVGMAYLEGICKLLNKHTLVDDRCGIHVHVGSLFKPTIKDDKPKTKQAPSFGKQFLINSINLGALIEEELYTSLPSSRTPTLYHCHSIRRFAPINDANFGENLGAYLFGPKEGWKKSDQCPEPLWSFKKYAIGPNYNQNTQLGAWADGRYKWLNLIPSYCNGKNRTIELRIFPGTTVFEKVRAYLLTSLCFTDIADNHPNIIKPGITLSQMFKTSFPKHPEIVGFLEEFYEERKSKFKRKNIYPKLDLPFLK